MSQNKPPRPTKPHHVGPHKSVLNQWQDRGAADALNSLELESQATRGKSITPEEGRELLATPKIVGDALIELGQKLDARAARKPSGPKGP